MVSNSPPIAIFAGEGLMPIKVINGIHEAGKKVLLIGMKGVTPPNLTKVADYTTWGYLTQLGKAVKTCKQYGVKEVILAGRVRHTKIFSLSLLKMDWTTLTGWLKLKDKRADSIFHGIVEIFAKNGIKVMSSVHFLGKYLAKKGVLTEKKPTKKILEDILFGKDLACEIGKLDIGQTVVVKNKTVVAVEAMEGTDLCLERAGQIAGEGCVIIKMPKPKQDMRFDVPVIGVNTIEKLAKIKAPVLAIGADKTLLIDENTIEVANKLGIIIIAL